MERTEHKITLDVHKTVSTTSVSVKKGDTAHRLLIILSEGGYPYRIGEDCTAVFSAVKPDGTTIWNDCTIDNDVVIYDFTEQTTAALGVTNCEIQIYDPNGALLTSASFLLFVEDGASNRSAVVSSDEFAMLQTMVANTSAVAGTAGRAAERANKAAGACMVIGSASGETIRLDDAIDAEFVGMRIFGRSTQNGTPTPANPATLVSVGSVGSIKLTSGGKNLLPYPFYQSAPTLNGVTYTDNGDGSITVSGTATDYTSFWFTRYDLRLRKGVTYTISVSGNYSVTGGASLLVSSKDKGSIASVNLAVQKSLSYTAEDDYTDVGVYMILTKAGYAITGTIYPQLELGSVATQYEPYKGNSVTIPVPGGLPGIPVASGGNYTDANGQQWICDEIDFANGVYIKRTHTRLLNGSGTLLLSQQGGHNRFEIRYADDYLAHHGSDTEADALCSHFPVSLHLLGSNHVNGIICPYKGSTRIFLRFDECATVEELAAWLSANPVTFVYRLGTPIETDLPDEVMDAYQEYIRSHSGDTVVSNDSDAHMALEYIMDARKYIDKMISTGIHEATLE